MTATKQAVSPILTENFHFLSSLADDVWHQSTAPNAYEWWYFDALSDDGRDSVVVIFLDNFIFSPRYNSSCGLSAKIAPENAESVVQDSPPNRFPAVAFTYYRDGKPLYRSLNEFAPAEFSAGTQFPSCRIGENSFQFEATPYGTRYIIEINAVLRQNRKLHAALEWLVVESDFSAEIMAQTADGNDKTEVPPAGNSSFTAHNSHTWNLVSPRSDVTGKIEIISPKNKISDEIQFRGTGYHDHNFDSRRLPETVAEWQWGRAHFADATAVFYRYLEIGANRATTNIFLIKNGELSAQPSNYESAKLRRDRFGLVYPRIMSFSLNETGGNLLVGQNKPIDSSFFYLRFLSEFSLDLGDGKLREATGITEHLAPHTLRHRWLDWLVNMRIGRNGKGAFLP